MGVVGDRQQPQNDVAPRVELAPMGERTLERVLHQIVGVLRVEDQRARIAPQPRDRGEQLLAEGGGGVHAAVVTKAYVQRDEIIPRASGARAAASSPGRCRPGATSRARTAAGGS